MIPFFINKYKVKLNNNLHFKEILFGSANTLVLKILGMVLALGVTLLISKKYGAEGIGLYNLSVRTITFLALVSTLGINTAILRYAGQFNKNGSKYKLKLLFKQSVQIVLLVSVLVGLLLFLSSDLIAKGLFNNINYKNPLRILSISIPFMALLNINVEYIRGLKSIKISETLRSIARPVINITLLITIGLFMHSYLLPIFTFSAAIIVSALISLIFIYNTIRNIPYTLNSSFSKNELLNTSFPMLVILVISFLQGNLSIYFLEIYASTDKVGIFSVCLGLSSLTNLSLIAVNTIRATKFSELYWSNQHAELQKVILHSSKLIFILFTISGLTMIVFAKQILNIFGNEFINGTIVLIILVIVQFIQAVCSSAGLVLNMTGHQKNLRNILLLIIPINLLLHIIFVPKYGMIGASVVNMVTIFLLNISAVIYIQKNLSLLTFYLPFLSNRIIHK